DRDTWDDRDRLRYAVRGELGTDPLRQALLIRSPVAPRHNERVDGLSRLLVVGTHYVRLVDVRVTGEDALDRLGVARLPLDPDHVTAPTCQVQETVAIHVAEITSVQPAVPEHFVRLQLIAPVAHHHVRAAHVDLADLAGRCRF